MIAVTIGFGFLSFETDESVERCVAEHFVNLNGKQVYFIGAVLSLYLDLKQGDKQAALDLITSCQLL
jgi:hypothetical protein